MTRDLLRRDLLRFTAASVAAAPLMAQNAMGQTLDPAEAERILYPAPGLPGGGQMEVRMMVEGEHPDPHIAELARVVKPFNLESWHGEFKRFAELNEKMAGDFLSQGRKVTAGEFYLRAAGFYRSALVYMPVGDKRTMPTYDKLKETFDKAWSILPPPFERVWIPYEGKKLMGFFFPARAPAGKKAPVVFNYGGADGILMSGAPDGGSGQYRARGISFLDVDGPGQGWALRKDEIYAPPDTERYGKAVADYLMTRDDVDHDRMAIHGSSMGGYTAPRVCTVEKRFKACAVWSGAYSLQQDIWDYYPPIRERLRWLIGAKDFDAGRKMMADFTLEGRTDQIECPLLVGYSIDDRVMDPRGALRLYKAATRGQQPEMIEGTGHGHRTWEKRQFIADWFAKQLGTA
jgi:dipeptidyl aminopeptidase/acylaminoacyl peptidase